MGRVPYSEFVGSRVRFQRMADQRVFAGWIRELRSDCVSLASEEPLPPDGGARYLFQVQGPSADAYFIATCREAPVATTPRIYGATAVQAFELPELEYAFDLITQVQLRDAQQHARKVVATMAATMSAQGKTSEVLVSDASSGGMGIIAWEELRKGDVVGVEVRSGEMNAGFYCEVRHCRPEPRLVGAYRVGLQFQRPERLALTAWRKLINPL